MLIANSYTCKVLQCSFQTRCNRWYLSLQKQRRHGYMQAFADLAPSGHEGNNTTTVGAIDCI